MALRSIELKGEKFSPLVMRFGLNNIQDTSTHKLEFIYWYLTCRSLPCGRSYSSPKGKK